MHRVCWTSYDERVFLTFMYWSIIPKQDRIAMTYQSEQDNGTSLQIIYMHAFLYFFCVKIFYLDKHSASKTQDIIWNKKYIE